MADDDWFEFQGGGLRGTGGRRRTSSVTLLRDPRVDPIPGDVLDDDPPAPHLVVWKHRQAPAFVGAARYTETECTFSGEWSLEAWRKDMADAVVLETKIPEPVRATRPTRRVVPCAHRIVLVEGHRKSLCGTEAGQVDSAPPCRHCARIEGELVELAAVVRTTVYG